MEISLAQNVAGQIQELLQMSCIFFANWFAFFLHVFCILILAVKMALHFFCIIFAFFLHFFCILIFGGPFFSCICLAFFCIYIFFYVSQEEALPDHTSLVPSDSSAKVGSKPSAQAAVQWSRFTSFEKSRVIWKAILILTTRASVGHQNQDFWQALTTKP